MESKSCVACGSIGNLHQHHLVPRSAGGSDDKSNLITLCGSCHAKAHQVKADWRNSELTRNALRRKKEIGERMGKLPYGFTVDKTGIYLEPCEKEQAVIGRIIDLKKSGCSLRLIADTLNHEGIFNRHGNKWNHVLLSLIIKGIDDRALIKVNFPNHNNAPDTAKTWQQRPKPAQRQQTLFLECAA